MSDDYAASIRTDGNVAVGGSAAGDIETTRDRDWFAVELVAGRTYVFDLEGSPTGAGTLSDTYLRGIHDANGNRLSGTTNDDGGTGYNSRVTFTATESGTHYVAAGAYGSGSGTYELSVTDTTAVPQTTPVPQTTQQTQAPADADAVRAGATDLGDITGLAGPAFPRGNVDGGADAVDYFRFTLSAAKEVHLGLRQQEADADLFIEDEDGNVLYRSSAGGTANEELQQTLLAGTYYVRIEAQEAGASTYVFRYGVNAPDPAVVAGLEAQQQQPEPPEREPDITPESRGTPEPQEPPVSAPQMHASVSEPADGDLPGDGTTDGYIAVGGSVTGDIERDSDLDWFAVDLIAGRTYVFDLEGWYTGGTLEGCRSQTDIINQPDYHSS